MTVITIIGRDVQAPDVGLQGSLMCVCIHDVCVYIYIYIYIHYVCSYILISRRFGSLGRCSNN